MKSVGTNSILLIPVLLCCTGCSFLPPIVSLPAPTPTVSASVTPCPTATIAPTVTATAIPTVTPTAGKIEPPLVETFRGGLKKNWSKQVGLICSEGDMTLWFYMSGFPAIQTCDVRSRDRSPCDQDHFSCDTVKTNCSNTDWDAVGGGDVVVLSGKQVKVTKKPNQYGFIMCAKPGAVSFNICPKTDFYSCGSDATCKTKYKLKPKDGTGCSGPHSYVFPVL